MRPFLLFLLGAAACLCAGCRQYSPVERHFLRVPALTAEALAGPDRARWLKHSRRQPGFKETALRQNTMVLSQATRPSRVSAAPGEVSFFPDAPGSGTGVVALNWDVPDGSAGRTRLYLLKTSGAQYLPIPLDVVRAEAGNIHRFSLVDHPGAITTYREISSPSGPMWRKAGVWSWSPQGWRSRHPVNRP